MILLRHGVVLTETGLKERRVVESFSRREQKQYPVCFINVTILYILSHGDPCGIILSEEHPVDPVEKNVELSSRLVVEKKNNIRYTPSKKNNLVNPVDPV